MFDQKLFKAEFTTGQTIRLSTADGIIYDSCDANIGVLQGKARSIPAILCDGANDTDQWQVMNIVDSSGMFLDHIAIKGAVSDDQSIRLCQKYLAEARQGQVRNTVPVTYNGLKTFLDSAKLPNNTAYFLQSDALLLDAQGTINAVVWDEEGKLISHGGRLSQMMLDMAGCDIQGDLLEQVTPRDVVAMFIDDTCEFGGGMFDAMIIKVKQLEPIMQKLAQALKATDNEEFFVKSVTPIEPFKRQNVVNVGAIFEMSDTQTITVLFNNPDTTPSKLTDTDVLTSWKWILNKRDVTAILQPRAVDARKYPQIASRMHKLLAKNHDRFKRAQAAKNKDELLLAELVDQVEASQLELRTLQQSALDIQAQIDAETTRKQQQTEAIAAKSAEAEAAKQTADEFHQNLKNTLENSEENTIQKAVDIYNLLMNEHGFKPDALADQGKHTYNLISANENHLAIVTFIDEENNGKWTVGFSSGGEMDLTNINRQADVETIVQQIVDADIKKEAPNLDGDEFGEFNLPEDNKELRAAVKQALVEMVGKSFPCPSLNTDVEVRTSGVKKIISNSADIRKLQAVAALKKLLADAVKIDEKKPYDEMRERNIVAYHFLEAPLKLKDELLKVTFVVREDDKGHYHYDHRINSDVVKNAKSPLLDGLLTATFPMAGVSQDELVGLIRLAGCQLDNSIEINQSNVNTMLDSVADTGSVLNMFIEVVKNEQNVQMNNKDKNLKKSVYVVKNPKPRTRKPLGTVTINTLEDATYSAFVSMSGVGGEYVGDLDGVKNWLSHRLMGMGEAVSGETYSFKDTASKLVLEIGPDVLGVNDIPNPYQNASLLDLSKGVVSELVALGWEKSGSTAIRTIEINNQPVRLKFQFDPFAKGIEIWISRDDSGNSVGRFSMPDMSEIGIKNKAAEMNEAVTEFINNQSSETIEQNVQMNNDEQFLKDIVAGSVDLLADETDERIEKIGENLDPSLESLFEQAIEVYSQAALKNAQSMG